MNSITMPNQVPVIAFFATRLKRTGPIKQMLSMLKTCVGHGYSVYVVTLLKELEEDSVLDEYLDVVPRERVSCAIGSKLGGQLSPSSTARAAFAKIKPDVIYSLGMPLYAIAIRYGEAAHVTTLRNYCYEDYPDRYGRAIAAYFCRRDIKLLRRAEHIEAEYIYACSSSLSDMYKERQGIDFPFIRNGVDCEKYKPASSGEKMRAREMLEINSESKVFVYAAIFNKRKNQEAILKAVANSDLPKEHIYIFLGDGPELDRLRKIYSHDCRFRFEGQVSNVTDYLAASDYYITSSLSEGLPNGVMEALSCGLPVIMSDIPQHREIALLGDAASVFDINDCETDCVRVISEMLSKDYESMSTDARRMAVDELSSFAMGSKYAEVFAHAYRMLLESRAKDE